MRLALVIPLLLLLPVTTIAAQSLDVSSGDHVRVWSTVHGYDGEFVTVAGVRGDTIVLLFSSGRKLIAASDLDRMQVRSAEGTYARRGTIIGFLAGVGAGALVSASQERPCPPGCTAPAAKFEPLAIILFATVGASVGWLVGSQIEFERWESVALPRRISVTPARGGAVAVSLSLTF